MKTLAERTAEVLSNPECLQEICDHVANGSSLIDYCRLREIRYSDAIRWIYTDPKSKERYESAIKARGEWFVQRILDEIKALGMVDIRLAYDERGKLLPPKQWPDEVAKAIASVETFEEYEGKGSEREYIGDTVKVKLWDKLRALELLAKNLGMLVEKHEVSGKVSLEDLVSGSMKQAVPPLASDSSASPGTFYAG